MPRGTNHIKIRARASHPFLPLTPLFLLLHHPSSSSTSATFAANPSASLPPPPPPPTSTASAQSLCLPLPPLQLLLRPHPTQPLPLHNPSASFLHSTRSPAPSPSASPSPPTSSSSTSPTTTSPTSSLLLPPLNSLLGPISLSLSLSPNLLILNLTDNYLSDELPPFLPPNLRFLDPDLGFGHDDDYSLHDDCCWGVQSPDEGGQRQGDPFGSVSGDPIWDRSNVGEEVFDNGPDGGDDAFSVERRRCWQGFRPQHRWRSQRLPRRRKMAKEVKSRWSERWRRKTRRR